MTHVPEQERSNNGSPVLKRKLLGKAKQWNKKYDAKQFFPQNAQSGGFFGYNHTYPEIFFFFNACRQINCDKNLLKVLWYFWIFPFLGPKTFHSLKTQSLLPTGNAWYQVQFFKHLMSRFRENLKKLGRFDPFTRCWA